MTTPVLVFAAYSGTGKTTLLSLVIPLLRARGLRLGLVKHSHHRFEIDQPGKDSYLLREAGASQIVLASRRRVVVMVNHEQSTLDSYLRRVDDDCLDLLLVEGYKKAAIDKIEVYRPSLQHPLLAAEDDRVIAVATDGALPQQVAVPMLNLNAPASVADFVHDYARAFASAADN